MHLILEGEYVGVTPPPQSVTVMRYVETGRPQG